MAHELIKLKQRLSNTPHLIDQTAFDSVLEYLNDRNAGQAEIRSRDADEEFGDSRVAYNEDTAVGILNISGPLTYSPVTMFGMDCGGSSYKQMKNDFAGLVSVGAKTVVLNIDSGGGEAHGCFTSAEYVKKMAAENGVKLISYVDGRACSAAYAWAAIADEIIVSPGSELGSIGVLVHLINDSKALEKEGYERTFVTAGASKVPFDKDGSFRKEFIEDIQEKVDITYEEFVTHVSKFRNMSIESVKATQAKTFIPSRSLEIGLADGEMIPEDFYTYLAEKSQPTQGEKMFKPSKFKLNKEETSEMTLAELQSQVAELNGKFEGVTAELAQTASALALAQSTLTEKDTALAAALSEVETLKAAQATAKVEARKTSLSAVLAADKVDSTLAALQGLDDSAFDTVLSGFKAQAEVSKQSEMMQEMGSEGTEVVVEAPAALAGKESTTALALQKRLGKVSQ